MLSGWRFISTELTQLSRAPHIVRFGQRLLRFPAQVLGKMANDQMERAVVVADPASANVVITFTLDGKTRNLNRPKNEPLSRPLDRLRQTLSQSNNNNNKKAAKKRKGLTDEDASASAAAVAIPADGGHAQSPLVIALLEGPGQDPVDEQTLNGHAWAVPGRVLQVGDASFLLSVNPPAVERVVFKGQPVVGAPLVPMLKLRRADVASSQFRWQRCVDGSWVDIAAAQSFAYTPSDEDLGLRLRVLVTPGCGGARGDSAESVSDPVGEGPPVTAAARRQQHTAEFLQLPCFRAVTYNLLADQYASTDYAREHLFSYCPARYLDIDYRKQLILAELMAYHADIILLQEVDVKLFEEYYAPYFETAGYAGVYSNKEGKVAEGCALFARNASFRIARQRHVGLRKCFAAPLPASHAVFAPVLKAYPDLRHALQKVTTIGQLAVLEPTDSELPPICVLNTHLFFHPKAPNIRAMQVAALLSEATRFIEKYRADTGRSPTLLFGGDLNSRHDTAVVDLLKDGGIGSGHADWALGASFKWGHEEEEGEALEVDDEEGKGQAGAGKGAGTARPVVGADLAHPYSLAPVDGLSFEFTNYVRGYQAPLDYLWYEPARVEVTGVVPLPTEDEVCDTYCPSQRFPSDHLAVVCDMVYRTPSSSS